MQRYEVARGTAVQAVRVLVDEGLCGSFLDAAPSSSGGTDHRAGIAVECVIEEPRSAVGNERPGADTGRAEHRTGTVTTMTSVHAAPAAADRSASCQQGSNDGGCRDRNRRNSGLK